MNVAVLNLKRLVFYIAKRKCGHTETQRLIAEMQKKKDKAICGDKQGREW